MTDEIRKLTTAELVEAKPAPEEFATWPRYPIYVICDNVRSLMNVGLIFRLCDATRVTKLYLCGITGYPPLPNDPRPPWVSERAGRVIDKTAIHTVQYVPWEYHPDALELIRDLKTDGVRIVVFEQTTRSENYAAVPYEFPLCLVLGHEREGVEDPVLALADHVVAIPMYGMGNSLNVAMAFGIGVYEILRCCLLTSQCPE